MWHNVWQQESLTDAAHNFANLTMDLFISNTDTGGAGKTFYFAA